MTVKPFGLYGHFSLSWDTDNENSPTFELKIFLDKYSYYL